MLFLNSIDRLPLALMLSRYGLDLRLAAPDEIIPGSYWGDSEAGLIGSVLYARLDTPVHSALHEACHFICMTPERRAGLDRDAGGDHAEECAVCYLQVLLGAQLPGVGFDRIVADMDAWGYSFRLGSTLRWLREDAADALAWLVQHEITDASGALTGLCRS